MKKSEIESQTKNKVDLFFFLLPVQVLWRMTMMMTATRWWRRHGVSSTVTAGSWAPLRREWASLFPREPFLTVWSKRSTSRCVGITASCHLWTKRKVSHASFNSRVRRLWHFCLFPLVCEKSLVIQSLILILVCYRPPPPFFQLTHYQNASEIISTKLIAWWDVFVLGLCVE